MITVLGESFGNEQGSSFIALDNTPVTKEEEGLASWSDLKIQLALPTTYKPKDVIRVRANRDGEWSADNQVFQVTA